MNIRKMQIVLREIAKDCPKRAHTLELIASELFFVDKISPGTEKMVEEHGSYLSEVVDDCKNKGVTCLIFATDAYGSSIVIGSMSIEDMSRHIITSLADIPGLAENIFNKLGLGPVTIFQSSN